MRAVSLLVLVAVCALVAFDARSTSQAAGRPTKAELRRLQDRIDDDWRALGLRAVYVASTAPDEDHVDVELFNPSPANRRLLRRRYGSLVRVSKRPGGPVSACAGYQIDRTADGPVAVPDVHGLGVGDAERALVAAGLTFEAGCRGANTDRPSDPPRWTPEARGRITAQCPTAGQGVAAGTSVVLGAVADLPGGFPYRFGPYTEVGPSTPTPCADGRNLDDAPTPPAARVESPPGYPVQVDAGGAPTSVAAADGTLVWLTSPNAVNEGGSFLRRLTLHTRRGSAVTAIRVRSRRELVGMTAGTDARGRLAVLAVAFDSASIDHPDLVGADVVTVDVRTGAVRPVAGLARSAVAESAVALYRGRLVVARRPDRRRGTGVPRSGLFSARLTGSAARPRATRLRRVRAADAFVRPSTRIEDVALTAHGRLATLIQKPRKQGGANEAVWVVDRRGAREIPNTRGLPDLRVIWPLSWQDGHRLWFGRTDRRRSYQVRYDAGSGVSQRWHRLGAPTDTAWAGGDLGLVAGTTDWEDDAIRPRTLFATGPLPVAP